MLPFSEAPPDINSLYIEPINHTQLNTFIISFNIRLTSCLSGSAENLVVQGEDE